MVAQFGQARNESKWDKGIHCHDYKKRIDFLEKIITRAKEEKQE